MVALNESFALENPERGSKNRVGNFFGEGARTRPVNRLPGQQPRRENGHRYDETASGMLFYGFRYYDPGIGRWLSRDPIAEEGGLNLYGFVRNDAVNQWDLFGMASFQGIVNQLCRIRRRHCIPTEFFDSVRSKTILLFSNGKRYNVFSDSRQQSGERWVEIGNFLGKTEGDTILFDAKVSNAKAIGIIFHEAFHIDNDIPGAYGGSEYLRPDVRYNTRATFTGAELEAEVRRTCF